MRVKEIDRRSPGLKSNHADNGNLTLETKMKLTRLAGLLAVALTVGSAAAYAAGNYSTCPILGGSPFCEPTAGASNVQAGNTGQGVPALLVQTALIVPRPFRLAP
jgi:hypothetical protein